jgi:hypothetical protein
VSLYALTSLHRLADVLGVFKDSNAVDSDAGLFVPLNPQRILDTRAVSQKLGSSGSSDQDCPGLSR